MGSGVFANQLKDCPRLYGIKIRDRSLNLPPLIRLKPFSSERYRDSSSTALRLRRKLDDADVTVGLE